MDSAVAQDLKDIAKDAVIDGDDPATIMKLMLLTSMLVDKGITEQQFEDKYELYERLCLASDYSISPKNVDHIYRELMKK